MADRRVFFGFMAIILAMMATAAVLIVLPMMAADEFRPSPRVITDTEEVQPFLLTSSQITGVLAHYDLPCIIVHFPVNAEEAAALDGRIRKAAEPERWDIVEAGAGSWRMTRVTEAKLGERDTQGSEEMRIRLEQGRVVLAWFREENTTLPLGQTKSAEYLKTRFWPSWAEPDTVTF